MSAKQKDVGSSPAQDQNFLCRFFRLCETFFRKCLQRVPLHFFSYVAKEWMFKNSQRPPFYYFRDSATYRRPKNTRKKISKKLRRSRLVRYSTDNEKGWLNIVGYRKIVCFNGIRGHRNIGSPNRTMSFPRTKICHLRQR